MAGAWSVLQRAKGIRIGRLAGASAGAWCAVFMACGLDPVDWTRTYVTTQRLMREEGLDLLGGYERFGKAVLPEDAHERCNGRVFISITRIENGLLKNEMVSHFESREDVLQCCMASSQLPFISCKGFGSRFRGRLVLDGGFTSNTPHFRDEISKNRAQLVFHLSEIPYPLSLGLNPADPCIEVLVFRGAVEMARAFAGSSSCKSIEWVRPEVDVARHASAKEAFKITLKWVLLIVFILPLYVLHKIVQLFSRAINMGKTI